MKAQLTALALLVAILASSAPSPDAHAATADDEGARGRISCSSSSTTGAGTTPAPTAARGSRRRTSTGWRARASCSGTPSRRTPSAAPAAPASSPAATPGSSRRRRATTASSPASSPVYPELLEKAGYIVGLTGKGWGPGDFKSTGFTRNPAGPGFDEHTTKPPASGIDRNDYAEELRGRSSKSRPAGPAVLLLDGLQGAAPRLRARLGHPAGKSTEDVKVPAYLPDTAARPQRPARLRRRGRVRRLAHRQGARLLEDAGELDDTLSSSPPTTACRSRA